MSSPFTGASDPLRQRGFGVERVDFRAFLGPSGQAGRLSALLESQGHEVRVAHDGPSTLEAAEAFDRQVVLLDIGLPGMDGYQVARELRSRERFRDTLLVALTGYGQAEDRRLSRESGFDHHLVKPVDSRAIHRLLSGAEVRKA